MARIAPSVGPNFENLSTITPNSTVTAVSVHRQSHLWLGVDGLLLQRQGELVLLVGLLLTLHLPGDTSCHTLELSSAPPAPQPLPLLPRAGRYLCDGEGLLLGVLAHTDHEQHLGGEQQAAGVLLTRPAHDDHLQGHVELRPPQRLEHLPAVGESRHREGGNGGLVRLTGMRALSLWAVRPFPAGSCGTNTHILCFSKSTHACFNKKHSGKSTGFNSCTRLKVKKYPFWNVIKRKSKYSAFLWNTCINTFVDKLYINNQPLKYALFFFINLHNSKI